MPPSSNLAKARRAGQAWALVVCMGLWLTTVPPLAVGDTWEGFEGPDNAWQLAEADADVRVLAHERTLRLAHGGATSEHLRLAVGAGNKVYLACDVAPARAIGELKLSLWLRSERAGPQLFARVVLPRTLDARTGKPVTVLLPGPSYSRAGDWEQLRIADVPLQVERQARILRAQIGAQVDTREAYIDKLLINAYTKPGLTYLWIDDLEITGQVGIDQGAQVRPDHAQASFEAPAATAVQLDGSHLLIDGKPTAIRAIEFNGESPEWLKTLGFNTILVREAPGDALLEAAQRAGVWVIAPPRRAKERIEVTSSQAPVVAWLLGTKLGPADLDDARALARELRSADSAAGRPMIAGASAPLSAYSRTASMLFVEPPALGGSFEMTDYSAWFAERTRLARPGTPLIAMLPSEPPAAVTLQFDALRPQTLLPHTLDYEQLRLLSFAAVAGGVRGICFRSLARLDGQSAAQQQRADILKLINAELQLIEPWMAAGGYAGEIDVDDKTLHVSSLQTDRARLLIARRYGAGQQWVLPAGEQAEKDRISLVLPGTPGSSHAYRLSTLGMDPLVHKRVTGGLHISIENAGTCSLVVLTQDPLVMNRVARDLAALEAKHAQLHYEITSRKVDLTAQAIAKLPAAAFPDAVRLVQQAKANQQQALRLLSANDRRNAEKYIALAQSQAAAAQRGHWEAAMQAFASAVESPLCTSFATLPAHYELAERLRTAGWSANVITGGDMERLEALTQSGWRHQRDPGAGLESQVELAPQAHGGQSSLHLKAFAAVAEEAPSIVESPPVWVTTPPISVARNKLVRMRGFVRTSAEIAGSHDNLLVFDSIGGQALAARLRAPEEWRQFTLFRATGEDTTLTVTLALTGIGEAWLDDLEICVLDLPAARVQPSLEPVPAIDAPEEIAPPRVRAETLPAPQARGWWPRVR